MKKLLPIILVLFLTGCTRQITLDNQPKITVPGQPCTQEAKVCPDGTAVGRTGPNCEFAPCPVATATTTPASKPMAASRIIEPVAEFSSRITKKTFGMYITPKTSPVQPERFTGYHTGVDIEYGDVTSDVPVVAIADGTVVLARFASGYGGVIAIRHIINGKTYVAIYGHLDPARLIASGTQVKAGKRFGFLGKGYSTQTDGERKHLHFGLHIGSSVDIKGYVQAKGELNGWADPITVVP